MYKLLIVVGLSLALQGCVGLSKTLQVGDAYEIGHKYNQLYVYAKEDNGDKYNRFDAIVEALKNTGMNVAVYDGALDMSAGSSSTGIVLSEDGYFIMAGHMIINDKVATISIDDKLFNADVIATDLSKDLALLKVKNLEGVEVNAVKFAKSPEYNLSERVFSIGYSGNAVPEDKLYVQLKDGSVDFPIRYNNFDDFIQVTIKSKYANTGSPLFNSKGLCVGMVDLVPPVYREHVKNEPFNNYKDISLVLKSKVIKGFLKDIGYSHLYNEVEVLEADLDNQSNFKSELGNSAVHIVSGQKVEQYINNTGLRCQLRYDITEGPAGLAIDYYSTQSGRLVLCVRSYAKKFEESLRTVIEESKIKLFDV